MSSWQSRVFARAIRVIVRRRSWGSDQALVRRARRVFGAPPVYGRILALGLRRETFGTQRARGEWLTPRRPRLGVIFYIHGGGFVSCSIATHRPIAAALARHSRRRVLSVDYRLAPEAPLPAASEDVLVGWNALRDSGLPASEIAIVGDSAGGNLALGLAIRLRDDGHPLPACVVAFSPWTDLAGRSASVLTNDGRCVMFHSRDIGSFAALALGGELPDAPQYSPVYAQLHGLPPVMLHVGSTELLLDDSTRVCERIRQAGGRCELRVYDAAPHAWQMLAPWVPEATASIREAVAFIDAAFGGGEADLPAAKRPRRPARAGP